MNRYLLGMLSVILCVALASVSLAQNPPPPGPEGAAPGPGPGGGFGGGGGGFGGQGGFGQPPGDFGGRGGGGFGGGGRGARGGDDGRGRGRGGPGGPDLRQFEMLRSYIEVVDRYATMARSADAAGVAAVISASDILRPRGPEAATDFLAKMLPDVKIPAIERAIRIQLADLYRQSGQADKALEQLSVLMKAGN